MQKVGTVQPIPKRPYLQGVELLASITESRLGPNEVAVWWLGQSGYAFKTPLVTVYIDPYLSEHLTRKYAGTAKPHDRMTEAPLRSHEVSNADYVISTHKHSDHMDPETVPAILEASPRARYVMPRAHLNHVLEWGIPEDRIIPADAHVALAFPGLELVPVPSAHEQFDVVDGLGHPYLGFILRSNGVALYHSGDSIPYPGLVETLRPQRLDACFLPVNGRDARRHSLGTPGNFSIEEALCVTNLAEIALLVPGHYDMFAFNTADIDVFRQRATELYPALKTLVMECGREYRITSASRRR